MVGRALIILIILTGLVAAPRVAHGAAWAGHVLGQKTEGNRSLGVIRLATAKGRVWVPMYISRCGGMRTPKIDIRPGGRFVWRSSFGGGYGLVIRGTIGRRAITGTVRTYNGLASASPCDTGHRRFRATRR